MFELMPFERRNNIFSLFDSMDKDFFGNMDSAVSAIRTDISDKGDKYLLEAELPGFSKEDIHIDIDDDMLKISAQHTEETNEKRKGYVRRERKSGSFMRTFDISEIDKERISADYSNGVLTMDLPKRIVPEKTNCRIELK